MLNLATQLGYSEQDRLLIINCDDYGLSPSFNEGVEQLLQANVVSSATLMLPCAYARAAAAWSAAHQQVDVGIHFTFTSEWDTYKWGPVTRDKDVTSLVTKEGYFFSDCASFEQSASPSQVSLEMSNQIELALTLGIKPTHADSHMGSLYGLATGRHFLLELFDLCAHYGLPFRLPRYVNPEQQEVVPLAFSSQMRALAKLADQRGVVLIDYLIGTPFETLPGETADSYLQTLMSYLSKLKPGVTELIMHPSRPSDELSYFHKHAAKRMIEWEVLQRPELQQFLKNEGIKLIKWSELQQLQRSLAKRSYPF